MSDAVLAERIDADVAVVGAGPAGIAAAVSAASSGARVVVLDEAINPGGQIWRHASRAQLSGVARGWLDRLNRSGAVVLRGASVVHATPERELTIQLHGAPRVVTADKVILATGARERFLPFPGWMLPNVVGIGGAQALLKSGASFDGKRVVIAGSGPLLLPVAAALAKGGAEIAVVAEQAPATKVLSFAAGLWRSPSRIAQAVRYRAAFRGTPYSWGTWVRSATGDGVVREATLTDGRRTWTEPCDLLCTGYGLVPSTELAQLLGCELEDGAVATDEWQRTSLEHIYCAGEPTGVGGVESSLVEGEIAGFAAAGREQAAAERFASRDRYRSFTRRLEQAFAPRDELRTLAEDDTIVCRCEDVVYGRLRPEWSARQAKLYTRAGMGPCQGRVCGPALEYLFDWNPDTVRVPIMPAAVDTLIHAVVSDDAS